MYMEMCVYVWIYKIQAHAIFLGNEQDIAKVTNYGFGSNVTFLIKNKNTCDIYQKYITAKAILCQFLQCLIYFPESSKCSAPLLLIPTYYQPCQAESVIQIRGILSWGFKIGNANISILLQHISMSQKQHKYNAIYSSKKYWNQLWICMLFLWAAQSHIGGI